MKITGKKIVVCFSVLCLVMGGYCFWTSNEMLQKENALLKNKILVMETEQYHALYKDEMLSVELLLVDTKKILESDVVCWIITDNYKEIPIEQFEIKEKDENSTNLYKVYTLNFSIKVSSSERMILKELCLENNVEKVQLSIGNIIVDSITKLESDNPQGIDILSTINSVDGESYSIIMQNGTSEPLVVKEVYYNILADGETYCGESGLNIIVPPGEEIDTRLNINMPLANRNISIRPIIKYEYQGHEYEILTHTHINFSDEILTKKDILGQLNQTKKKE